MKNDFKKKNAYEQGQIPAKADVQKHNLGKTMNSECQKLFLTCRFCPSSELLTTSQQWSHSEKHSSIISIFF